MSEEWLVYGQPAGVIDNPDECFARRITIYGDDRSRPPEYVLMPISLFDETAVENNQQTPGSISLDGVLRDTSSERYSAIVDQLDPVDVEDLVGDLVDDTVFTTRESQMVVLAGWFGMSRHLVSRHLDISTHTVRNHIEAAKDRYQKAKNTTGKMHGL